jgi:hypothetical protein
MATLISVHGTGATGPEEGQAWWQKGSAFEGHIRELVEGEDGELNFQRLIWDGANSETSRRIAARGLLKKMLQLESAGKCYCLIGHSHGGSIASTALILGAARRNQLLSLRKFITVGTPFVKMAKTIMLFSKLGTVGKSAYLSVFMLLLIGVILMAYEVMIGATIDSTTITAVTVLFFVPIILTYTAASWVIARRLYMYRTTKRRYADEHFAPLWISLFHRSDEAILGLRSLQRSNISLFPREFAVSFFSYSSIFIMPLVLIYFAMSPTVVSYLLPHVMHLVRHDNFIVKDGQLIGGGHNLAVNLELLFLAPSYYLDSWFGKANGLTVMLLLFPLSLFLLSIAITYVTRLAATFVSRILSAGLNRLARHQLRMSGFGADTEGEMPVDAQECPPWTSRAFSPLPDALSGEISDISNEAVAQSVAKFRSALDQIALRNGEDAKERLLSEYLTWGELIHCSYFSVPRFRMLVAYAIAHSEGFRPSAAFKSHPDYDLVARWFEEIQPKRAAP